MIIDLSRRWDKIKRDAELVYHRSLERLGPDRKFVSERKEINDKKAKLFGAIGEEAAAKMFGIESLFASEAHSRGDRGIDGVIPFGPWAGKTYDAKYSPGMDGVLYYQPKVHFLNAEVYIQFFNHTKDFHVRCAGWADKGYYQENWVFRPLKKGYDPVYVLERPLIKPINDLLGGEGNSIEPDLNFCSDPNCSHWRVVKGDIRCAKIGMSLKEMGFCPTDTGVVDPESKVVEPPDEDEQYDMFRGR